MEKIFLFLNILLLSTSGMASSILMILPLGSASHKNIFTPIAQKMGRKGHDVTIVSMYETKFSTTSAIAYRDVVASTAYKFVQDVTGDFNVFEMNQNADNINKEVMKKVLKHLPEYCEAFLGDPAVKYVWNTKPDLIMLPAFMNECGLAFVHRLDVPFVYVTTSGLTSWTADGIGNPENPAFVPNQYLPFSDDMTLIERSINSVVRVISPVVRRFLVLNRLESVVKKFLNDESVSLNDLDRSASVVLVNSHHSLGYPQPLSKNVIEIGGMHCRESKNLREIDTVLDDFLNEVQPNSALIFSLGSHIKSSQMPENMIQMFVNAFSRVPYNIVWKYEGERPANLTDNVLTRAWIPQQDILGHPSVGGFYTHGGLLSLMEATYHGVPVISMPIMSDQSLNAKKAASIGVGVTVDMGQLSEQKIVDAIAQVMGDSKYLEEAQRRSLVFRDQETHPVDRAVYWSEYVIRHKGAAHLKPASLKLSFVQYYLLDVITVLLTLLITSSAAVFWFVKIVLKVPKAIMEIVPPVKEHQSKNVQYSKSLMEVSN